MAEISIKALTVMFVMAILFAVGGALISLDRIGKLGGVSGLVFVNNSQSTGNVSLTIAANAQLTLQIDFVDFGSWRVNGSSTTKNCTLVSAINGTTNAVNNFSDYDFTNGTSNNAGAFTPAGDCVPVSPNPAHSFELENTGSEIFTNITINSSKSGGSGSFLTGVSSDILAFRSMEEGNACSDATSPVPGDNGTSGLINSITANFTICKNLTFVDSNDAVVVQINITLPSDTPAQTAGTVLTFAGQTFG